MPQFLHLQGCVNTFEYISVNAPFTRHWVCWSASTVKVIQLKICLSNLNYCPILPPHSFTPQSFSSGKISKVSTWLTVSQHTHHRRPNGQIRKEITQLGIHQITMMRGFLQSLLRSLRLGLEPDRALSQRELFTQYGAVQISDVIKCKILKRCKI